MKFLWFILIIGVTSYFGGVVLDGVALDENSKLGHLLTTGTIDDRWIPFSATQEKLSLLGILDSTSYSFMSPIVNYAQLAEGAQILISSASISFGIGSTLIDPDGIPNSRDEFLADGISECNFHSFDSFSNSTCVLCTLTSVGETGEHTPVAQGRMNLTDGYQGSTTLKIPITTLAFEGANDFSNVDGVNVQLCGNELGCTVDFWQQEQSSVYWPASIPLDETFENVFQRSPSKNGNGPPTSISPNAQSENDTKENSSDNIREMGPPQPTLLEVLTYSGSAKKDLEANAVAAILNAETLENNFAYSSEDVILMTQQSIDDKEYETTKDLFLTQNELGCPFIE
ncbi:MAG: hypothetical protein OEQ12_04360 [Nitrosopumilus sp.]|nr:hypothetical protein [Nitrosopumilus sp.]